MPLGHLLLWIVGISVFSLFFSALKAGWKDHLGWIVVCLSLTAITGAIWFFSKEVAGITAFFLWFFFILIPTFLGRKIESLSQEKKWKSARNLANVIRFLHPGDGFWQLPNLFRLAENAEKGIPISNSDLRPFLKNPNRRLGRIALKHILLLQNDFLHLSRFETPFSEAVPTSWPKSKPPFPWVTALLAGINIVVFLAELYLGGSTNLKVLFFLGALVPEAVYEYHQWWRILTANFLHFGAIHIGMNLFALLLLGPKLEVYLGKLKYLFIYLFAGCGSMAGVTYLAQNNFLKDQILVGASGCITGIIGASLGIYLKLWRQHKTENLKQSIRSVLFAIVLQTLFDLSTPEVSLSAHLLGSLSGFIIALLVKLPTSRSF